MSIIITNAVMQCRACMQLHCEGLVDMSYIIGEDGKSLYDCFNECTQLHATSIDNLPKVLCITCTDNLQAAFNFKQVARRSDEEFRKVFALQKVEAKFIYPNEDPPVLKECFEYDNEVFSETQTTEQKTTEIEIIVTDEKEDIIVDDIKIERFERATEDILVYEDSEASSEGEEDDNILNCGNTYTCDICSGKYSTKYLLKNHIFESHKDEIVCTECPKIFELPRELRLHNKLVHTADSPIYCPWCKLSKELPRAELPEHVRETHNLSYLKYFPRKEIRDQNLENHFECERCQKAFASAFELADHIHEHQYYCPICCMSFKRQNAYKSHIKQVHYDSISSMKAMLFDKEEKKGSESDPLFKALKTESDEELNSSLQCSLCSRQFKLQRSLELHMKITHKPPENGDESSDENCVKKKNGNENEFVECKYCHKKILSSKLVAHEGHHVYRMKKKGKYICAFCPREFLYETAVKLHEKNMHLREKLERKDCPVCHKKVDPYYLKKHIENVHTTERKFICDICSDGFKTYVQLVGHKRLHSDRTIPCSMCPKKFARPYDLKVHMRFHTGESPFACDLCDQRFRMRAHLTYHLQQHAGLKRKCNDCGKEFNSIRQLKIHSYRHTGMPYRCTVCQYGCALRDVFRKHLLRVHDMTMTDAEYCAMYKANTGRNPIVRSVEELK